MILTVLMENTALPGFHQEHGLSFHLKVEETNILLDAGSSGKFLENAQRLDISLENIDYAVLSHGHYDHSDGFRAFHQINEEVPLYLREEATKQYFSITDGKPKFVGIHKEVDKRRFLFVKERVFILTPHVYLVAQPEYCGKRGIAEEKFVEKQSYDNFCPDTFSHQQSLVVMEKEQLVILNSCSHGDLREIVADILRLFPHYKKFSVVGGLHFQVDKQGKLLFEPEKVTALAKSLKEMGLVTLATGHCTSDIAYTLLEEVLADSLVALTAGETYQFH